MADQLAGAAPRVLSGGGERSAIFSSLLDQPRQRPTIAIFEDPLGR